MKPKSNETTTFVVRSEDNQNQIHILHLFVYPDEDCNILRQIVDGYGNLYIPDIKINETLKDKRLWPQGRLLAIFDGKVHEDEIKIRLESTGFLKDDDEFVLFPCDRGGIEFKADTSKDC